MIRVDGTNVIEQDVWGKRNVWPFARVLDTAEPFPVEPLADRMRVVRAAAAWAADTRPELSPRAQQLANFWQHFDPERVAERVYPYRLSSADTAPWTLTINRHGLFYRPPDNGPNTYYMGGEGQLFSDFWFYGPDGPIPDLVLRREIVERVRRAFTDRHCAAASAHFALFTYPTGPIDRLHWQTGDHVRTDELTVRRIGIEMNYWTFRDPPGRPGFLSFERFLHLPPERLSWIEPTQRAAIEAFLAERTP